MNTRTFQTKFHGWTAQSLVAILCAMLLAPGDTMLYAREASQAASSPDQTAPKIPNDQLDSLVAPIALYPDPLLAQVLAASTYPLEVIQLQQWLAKHSTLKDQALTDAVMKQEWDPSVQSLAPLPDLVKRLSDDIKWTTDVGNAFLAQQSDVMDAVQRMRGKAMAAGNLKSTEQQKVETQVVESKQVIVIQQANPQVIYVPVYTPTVVYGPPIYPYPAIYYPPPSYYAAGMMFAFGVGVAMGAYWGGGWGYGCGWGRNNTVIINNRNNYISHNNNRNINNVNRNGNNWQHNPQHRGGAPYSNKQIANQYGGTARGDSLSTRQANARQQQGSSARQPGASNLGGTGTNRAGLNGNSSPTNLGVNSGSGGNNVGNRQGSSAGTSASNLGGTGTNRAGVNANSSQTNLGANRSNGGNNIGNRQISDSPKSTSAFGGATSKSSAQASSARGASSMGASRGGGGGSGGRRR